MHGYVSVAGDTNYALTRQRNTADDKSRDLNCRQGTMLRVPSQRLRFQFPNVDVWPEIRDGQTWPIRKPCLKVDTVPWLSADRWIPLLRTCRVPAVT